MWNLLITNGSTIASTNNSDPMRPQCVQIMHLLGQSKLVFKKASITSYKMPNLPDCNIIPRIKPHPNGPNL